MNYQPRYIQFARVRGFEPGSPDAPLLYEFINWIRRKWNQWAQLNGRKDTYSLTPEDHKSFDEWLKGGGGMSATAFAIRLASDAHCIADNSVYALRFCPHILATLTGPGFSHANRKFAPLSIHGVLHFADVITGTLYDAAGIHHSSPRLQVVGLPSAVVETDVTEVRID